MSPSLTICRACGLPLIDEVMTSDVITVTEETELGDIVTLMEKHRIKRVPVVRGTKLVGIVSRANKHDHGV